ncbi:MAG: arginine deiminase family protein [candidate division Zixibacteria bacterium]|nr:arginine deiminase family protein [candidate division Zixibacteria bacterium]
MMYGGQSEIRKIQSILVKHTKDAFISQKNIDTQWRKLNYLERPDYNKAQEEYANFLNLLKREVSDIHYLSRNQDTGLDSIYTRDPLIITNSGAILCNMGKEERSGEPAATRDILIQLDIPILGVIAGLGRLEGGDVIWLDENTLVVGQGYRTNETGICQLKELTKELVNEFMVVYVPKWRGPGDVLHLMSLISPIDYNLAIVYPKLLPASFISWLINRGIKLLEVSESEFETMACNILTIAPRKCIMLSGNPNTKRILEEEGVKVWEYLGEEICKKGAGGPTCLTRPLLRMK